MHTIAIDGRLYSTYLSPFRRKLYYVSFAEFVNMIWIIDF